MMLAIPLDTKDSTTLSELYGRAPFFALLDTEIGSFKVIENEVVGKGPKSGDFLKDKGATSTIFYHMGEGVYKSFDKNGMDVFCADYCHDSIDQIFQKLRSSEYAKLEESNYQKLLDPGSGEVCTCGCENK